jgi:hypothetical protein
MLGLPVRKLSRVANGVDRPWIGSSVAAHHSHDISAEQRLVVGALEVGATIDDLVSLFAGVTLTDLVHAHDPAVLPFTGACRLVAAAFGASKLDYTHVRGVAGPVGLALFGAIGGQLFHGGDLLLAQPPEGVAKRNVNVLNWSSISLPGTKLTMRSSSSAHEIPQVVACGVVLLGRVGGVDVPGGQAVPEPAGYVAHGVFVVPVGSVGSVAQGSQDVGGCPSGQEELPAQVCHVRRRR